VADNVPDGYRHVAPHLPALLAAGHPDRMIVVGAQSRRHLFTASVGLYAGLVARALGASEVTIVDARAEVRAQAEALVFVGVQNAANAGVPAEQAGLAAALISASATLGGALGLAILSAIATSHTHHLLAQGVSHPAALSAGFGHALMACSLFLVAAAAIAARTAGTRGQQTASPDLATVAEAA